MNISDFKQLLSKRKINVSDADLQAELEAIGVENGVIPAELVEGLIEELTKSKQIAVQVPIDRLAVSRPTPASQGLAVKPQTGMTTRKQRRSPKNVQAPQPINLNPVETVDINLPQVVQGESLLDRQVDELEAQQMLAIGLQQVGETAKTIVSVRRTLNEAQLRISLSLSGLDNGGTYEECLQRWNNYVLEQQQEIAEIESATLQLAQQNNAFLQSLGMAV